LLRGSSQSATKASAVLPGQQQPVHTKRPGRQTPARVGETDRCRKGAPSNVPFDEQSREGSIRVESRVCSNPFFLFANSMFRIPVKSEVCGTAIFRAEELHDS
jgi:hypothetical protein